ncbi:MAG: glycosidase [Phycisphaerae bacterium]
MAVQHENTEPLLVRHAANPILTGRQWPYAVNSVFNAGAVRLPDGDTLLLCRVETRSGRSHLCAARSADGVSDWRIDSAPTLLPDLDHRPEETWGIEDPRVVHLPEIDRYAVTYTCYSNRGPGVSLALTEDFKSFERLGVVLPPENKNAAVLPRRIDGRWAMIHRPVSAAGGSHIWLARSPDLRHWGDHTRVLAARRGSWWDAPKIGLGPPLVETPQGRLMIYHGAHATVAGPIYRVGLALLDPTNPAQCLLRSNEWILGPESSAEQIGDVGNVVFPCGYTIGDDGDTLNLYYGAADTAVCLATGSIHGLLKWLRQHGDRPAADNEV